MVSVNPGSSGASGCSDSFEKWVRENGGDDKLIELLKANGFTSKLSLGNLDFKSPDAAFSWTFSTTGKSISFKG